MAEKFETTLIETYTLPSKGRLDNVSSEIVIRSMTTQEEKLRLGSTGRFFKTMSEIIDKCVVSPENFHSYDLTINDFVFLLYKLRIVSYGNNYKVSLTCPECGKSFTTDQDLDKLNVVELPEEFSEPYDIGKLPRSKKKIGIKLLRTKEIDEIAREADAIKKKYPDAKGDETYPLRLQKQIVLIDGEHVVDSIKAKFVQ